LHGQALLGYDDVVREGDTAFRLAETPGLRVSKDGLWAFLLGLGPACITSSRHLSNGFFEENDSARMKNGECTPLEDDRVNLEKPEGRCYLARHGVVTALSMSSPPP